MFGAHKHLDCRDECRYKGIWPNLQSGPLYMKESKGGFYKKKEAQALNGMSKLG
jgi:hypothetical protein